jgi:hypothetical protein
MFQHEFLTGIIENDGFSKSGHANVNFHRNHHATDKERTRFLKVVNLIFKIEWQSKPKKYFKFVGFEPTFAVKTQFNRLDRSSSVATSTPGLQIPLHFDYLSVYLELVPSFMFYNFC